MSVTPENVKTMKAIIALLKRASVKPVLVDGWDHRGRPWTFYGNKGLLDHHDASTIKSGEWGSLGVITNGRTGIPGPLAHFQGARCLDGIPKVAIVAAGGCNHAGFGGPWQGVAKDQGNPHLYGVEWANNGLTETYTEAANYAKNALYAAVLEVTQNSNVSKLGGHKEWAPGRKSDPKYDMNWRRAQVKTFLGTDYSVGKDDGDMQLNEKVPGTDKTVGQLLAMIPTISATANKAREDLKTVKDVLAKGQVK